MSPLKRLGLNRRGLARFGVCALLAGASCALAADITRQDTTLDFGDFQARAQWTFPAGASGKLPAVLLIRIPLNSCTVGTTPPVHPYREIRIFSYSFQSD